MKYYQFKNKSQKKIPIGKIVCLARSYKKHAQEMKTVTTKEPLIFLKPSTSVIFNGETIIIPKRSNRVEHEVELGVIIKKNCKNVSKEKALNYILGYNIGLDITARDIQKEAKQKGWPWSTAKGFDTFAPISKVIEKEKINNPNNLNISLKVNGKIKQKDNTGNMVYSIEEIIEFVSNIMTLEKGDLILTGTPSGVEKIKKGDMLEAKLDKYCSLKLTFSRWLESQGIL